MTIKDIKVTTIAVPLEAPLRHSAGAHWGRFIRTIVEVISADKINEAYENVVSSKVRYRYVIDASTI